MLTFPILIAAGWDIGEIVKLAMVIIFVLGGLIKALSNAAKAANQRSKTPLPDLQSMRPEPAPEATIEDFLERVNRQRTEAARRAQKRLEPAVVEAEVIEAEPYDHESVSQHVTRHVGTRGIAQRMLPHERMNSDDAAREVQLGKFKHQVGRLTETEGAHIMPAPEPVNALAGDAAVVTIQDTSAAAAQLLTLLRSPQGLRQAIVLNEIFNRPELAR